MLLIEFAEQYQAGRVWQYFGGMDHCQNYLEISGEIEAEK